MERTMERTMNRFRRAVGWVVIASGAIMFSVVGLGRVAAQGPAVPEFGATGERALRVIGDERDGLSGPRDLAFNPERPYELWTVNRPTDGTVLYFQPGTPQERVEARLDKFRNHFMEEVSSVAFGDYGNFATCQESRNTYNRQHNPNDFMGPTLWTADLSIYARINQTLDMDALLRSHQPVDPAATLGFAAPVGRAFACLPSSGPGDKATRALRPFDVAQGPNPRLGSHIDMLHQSPNCMGIEHEAGNAYWAFDGLHGHLVRYDFAVDHGPGWDDHSDGIVRRYVEAKVGYTADIPGHLALDKATGWLYAADPGAGRVIRLKIDSGRRAETLEPDNEPLAELSTWRGTTVEVVASGLKQPSGVALHAGRLFVGQATGGEIVAYDTATLAELGRMDTDARRLAGLEVGPDGRLYFVDTEANTLIRVDPDRRVAYEPPVVTPQPSFTPSVEPTRTPRAGQRTPTPLPATATATATATTEPTSTDVPTATATEPPSATPTVTNTPTPEPSPTPSRWWGFMPFAVRGVRR
ncbi:MAG: hypothetical protein IPG72_04675 [Ardenticatenales bacterium]|jgi:hypothetical protein|nr:hypothetical protein [Ardenticatenales bacterium]